jgi:hypothetical protein
MLRATLLAVLACCHVEGQQPGDNYVVEPLPGSGGCRGVAEFLGAGPATSALRLQPLQRVSDRSRSGQVASRTTSGTQTTTVSSPHSRTACSCTDPVRLPRPLGKKGGKPPAGEQQHRALPYAVPGCYGESTALPPLPLISSYKSEKSLCGADCTDGQTPDSKENPNPCKTAPDPPACDRTKMTDDYCASLCLHWAQAGKIPGAASDEIYSGTQFAFTCWCGTAADASKLVSVDDKLCNSPCQGDTGMMCGGASLNHVMRVSCSRWGWTFVSSLASCIAGYILVGALYTHRTQGVPLTKAEFLAGSLLPNKAFWSVSRELVTDGVRFSRAKLRGEAGPLPAGGYSQVGSAAKLGAEKHSRREENDANEKRSSRGGSSKKKHTKEKSAKHESAHETDAPKRQGKGTSGDPKKRGTGREDPELHAGVEGEADAGGEGAALSARELTEQRDAAGGLHASQAKIKVIGINAK